MGTLDDLPQRPGSPGMLWHLGDYWYDTENEVLKVCTNDTIYEYEFEEVQFEQGKEYLIINKYGEEIYCYDRIREELKRVANYGASEEERENKVLVAHATNPRLTADGKTLYDCDVDIIDAFDFIAANGYIVVEGSMIGNRKLLLTTVAEIDGTYYIVGIVSNAGKLYDVSLSNPVNTAASTLTVSEIKLNAGVTDLDRRVTDLENNLSELQYNYNVTAQDLANYKTTVNSYLATIQSNTNRIVNLEQRCTSLSSAIQTNLNSINGLANRITALEQNSRTIDKQLDRNSTNPVENKAITERILELADEISQASGSVTIDDALNNASKNPVENRVITAALTRIEGLIENDSDNKLEPAYYDNSENDAYPEYTGYGDGGAKADGINYYDWPLVCYRGTAPNNIVLSQTPSNAEVSAPAERIINDYGLNMAYTTDDVFYSERYNKFILLVGGVYYDTWVNSNLWNDPVTNKPRTDTLYSDITPTGAAKNKAVRTTKFYNGTSFVNITDTMTNDYAAIKACIEANKGGTVKFTPNKIYFIELPNDTGVGTHFVNMHDSSYNNTIIDGNGATLFVRTSGSGRAGFLTKSESEADSANGTENRFDLFNIQGENRNITIKNIKVKCLRDRDNGCPKGYVRLSSSESNIGFVSCSNASHIHIENIETKNLHADYSCNYTCSYIFVDGIKSINVVNNFVAGTNIYINNVDAIVAPYSAGGFHWVYGSLNSNYLYFSNCKVRAANPYHESTITWHADGATIPASGTTRHTYFDNCYFGFGAFATTKQVDVYGRYWIHFRDCVIEKTAEVVADSSIVVEPREWLIQAVSASLELDNCLIFLGYGYFAEFNITYTDAKLIINHCSFYSKLKTATNNLFGHFNGTVEDSKDNWTNYPLLGPVNLGNNRIKKEIQDIQNILNDETLEESASAPISPDLGDKYYDTTLDKGQICTNVGAPTRFGINLNPNTQETAYNVTHVVTFNSLESISFTFSGITTYSEVKQAIDTVMSNNGYAKVTSVHNLVNGTYMIHDSGNDHALIICSKTRGAFYDGEHTSDIVTNTSSSAPFKQLNTIGTSTIKSVQGTNPTWSDYDPTGLIAKVADLITRVEALENA